MRRNLKRMSRELITLILKNLLARIILFCNFAVADRLAEAPASG